MASRHTEQFGFNLWEPGDSVLRGEFNENTEKTEAAISACFRPDNLPWVAGTYVETNTEDVTITLGYRPSAVFLSTSDPSIGFMMGSASFALGRNRNFSSFQLSSLHFSSQYLEDGFKIPAGSSYFNDDPGRVVTYIAFR